MAKKNQLTSEPIVKTMDIEAVADFLVAAFVGMENNKKTRTYMSLGRSTLNADWFNARGIREKFDMNYLDFILENLFEPDNKHFVKHYCKDTDVKAFAVSIADEMVNIYTSEPETFAAIFTEMKEQFNEPLNNALIKFLADIDGTEVETQEDVEVEEQTETQAPPPVVDVQVENKTKKTESTPVVKKEEVVKPEEMKVKNTKGEKTKAEFSFNIPLSEMIDRSVIEYIENESGLLSHVDKRIEAEAMKLRPNNITISDRKPVVMKGRLHTAFKRTMQLTMRERQVFIAGPAGTGKTTLGIQVAEALSLQFGHISCTAGMSEAHLLGRMNAHGEYISARFVECYENGGVFLFDEVETVTYPYQTGRMLLRLAGIKIFTVFVRRIHGASVAMTMQAEIFLTRHFLTGSQVAGLLLIMTQSSRKKYQRPRLQLQRLYGR
jgi:hypothetical protein